jgi:hypothetical protein
MRRTVIQGLFTGSVLGLTAVSLCTFSGDADHAFVSFKASEALIYIGLSSVLAVLWILFAVSVIITVWKQQVSRCWLLVLPLAALGFFAMATWPFTYVQDITHSLAEKH